jgi:hypothetical protein
MLAARKPVLITVVAWNLGCVVTLYVHGYVIGPAIAAVYTAWFGDIQASYGRFEWIATISSFITVPLPSTIVALRLYDALAGLPFGWRRLVASTVAWQVLLFPILLCSYMMSFGYRINQLGWAIFGPPENLYSYTNLVLPRIVAWLLCTTPVCVAALWLHRRMSRVSQK